MAPPDEFFKTNIAQTCLFLRNQARYNIYIEAKKASKIHPNEGSHNELTFGSGTASSGENEQSNSNDYVLDTGLSMMLSDII